MQTIAQESMSRIPIPELWTECNPQNHYEIIGAMIREALRKEKIKRIDLSYLGKHVVYWWGNRDRNASYADNYANLKLLILENLDQNDLKTIKCVGLADFYVAAVFLEHVFHVEDKELALLVHEVVTEISGIIDIKYPYEEHKELYPKTSENVTSDWGRGLGIIRPHSDDLYEERPINAMCLTVCRDISKTPTWFWLLRDIVACLSDDELGRFVLANATFLSGKNVEGKVIGVVKPVLRRDPDEGIGMRIDFRIDDAVGARMRFDDDQIQFIFDKMRQNLRRIKPICSTPDTGSISILSNYKVLHGRSSLSPVMLYEGEASRVLFRSKGIK